MTRRKKNLDKDACCPSCGSDGIDTRLSVETIVDRKIGKFQVQDYAYSVCSACNAEFITARQARENDKKVVDARRSAESLLGSAEIAAVRKKLRLTQEEASKIFGGGRNAFSKYEQGYVTQSIAMDRLLRVANEFPLLVLPFLRELAGQVLVARPKRIIAVGKAEKDQAREDTEWYDFVRKIQHSEVIETSDRGKPKPKARAHTVRTLGRAEIESFGERRRVCG